MSLIHSVARTAHKLKSFASFRLTLPRVRGHQEMSVKGRRDWTGVSVRSLDVFTEAWLACESLRSKLGL